jgi:tetratricopeptide (TPR) repeat protein
MASTLNPFDGYARLSLGAAYLDRGQYDESIKPLSQIKDSPTARLLEATAYAKQGKAKEAATIYLSIPEEELSPKNVPQTNDRMVLLEIFKPIVKEHRDKARSFELKGQDKEALSELAEALKTADDMEVQDIQETIFSMIRRNPLLSEMPEDARKYALRSEVLVKEGNFEQAATELKKAIQIAPYAARLYFNAALYNAELKKYPEAIRHMKIYLRAAPDAPNARAAKDEIIKWEFMMESGQ